MARPIRIEYEGAVYHVTIRGNERKALFKHDRDRERFIQVLAGSVERYDVRLYLYCLMDNHAHFVLETPRANLSRFMQRFQTAYTVYYNRRHRRSGHLMQGRFGASIVDEDRYILKLSRYVHLNPVFVRANRGKPEAERIAILREYRWSSYRGYIGKAKGEDFVNYEPILSMMDGSRKRLKSTYRRFVEAGIMDIDSAVIDAKRRSPLCIGSDDSVERVEELYHELVEGRGQKEDISFRRQSFWIDQDTVLDAVCSVFKVEQRALYRRTRNDLLRSMSAHFLCRHSGCTQRKAGKILEIGHSSSVSRRLKQLHALLETDERAKELKAGIERILTQKDYSKG